MNLVKISATDLVLEAGALDFEVQNTAEIDAHWTGLTAENPVLWDGRVHFLTHISFTDGVLRARARQARFATLLYWRDQGFPEIGWHHAYGAAVLRASDGAYLLGRMAEHTANAGWVYFPGGALDPDDLVEGRLDTGHNIRREFAEETGLDPALARFAAEFVVASDGRRMAITKEVWLPWDAEESRARLLEAIASYSDHELAEILIVRDADDLAGLQIKPYARAIIESE